jgi:hypothetical protein
MKKKGIIIMLFSVLLFSCNKTNFRCNPIPLEDIFGTYDLRDGRRITLKQDFTYVHFYIDNGVMKSDTGIWRFHYFEAPLRWNLIYTYDMRAISENGERNYFTRYMTNRFFACRHWGRVIITRGHGGDPDGAPPLIWFRKIE